MMRESEARVKSRRFRHGASSLIRDLSLKHKLVAVIMLTCVASLSLTGGIFIAWEWTSLRRAMVRDVTVDAKIIAENCRAAVVFKDRVDTSAVLQSLSIIPSIMGACVGIEDERLFASYVRKGVDQTRLSQGLERDGAVFGREHLTVQVPITLDGQRIGTIALFSDLEPLYARLRNGIVLILGVLLASSVAAYLTSSRLQRIISSPILRLADVARLVSEEKAYAVRAEQTSGDEVGLLIQAFNEMLGQIEQRDAALVGANDQLEARVHERTAELETANERLTREIAARRQTDRALAEANEHLARTVHDLRLSNKELQDFAYVAAHDLKAPLRGIGTLADWMASDYADRFDDQGRQQLRLLKGRVTRLTELINGILHYSEIGRVAHHRDVVDLGKLVPETIALLAPPPQVQVVVHGELPRVVGERVRLGQVFHNLIDNAIKYMDKPQGRVEIGCTDRGRIWEFTVTDNGPGIEEKYFEKIFQMFQTLTPRDQRESTGIGLPIVKKIVELFGGRIWVESTPGEGATFFFTLPNGGAMTENEALLLQGASVN